MVVIATIKRNPRKRVFLCLFNIVDERPVALINNPAQDVSTFIAKMGHINPRGWIIAHACAIHRPAQDPRDVYALLKREAGTTARGHQDHVS